MIIEKTLNILNYKIYSWSLGNPQSPSIVMVHGILEHSLRYKDIAQFFANQGFHVVSFDLPGHGQSQGPKGFVRDFLDFGKITNEIYRAYNLNFAHLFGHSMGVLIAYQARSLEPILWKNTVLHNPSFYIGGTLEKFLIKILGNASGSLAKSPFYI